MSNRVVRQIYSGKEFEVVAENDRSLTLRPIPPTSPDFNITRFFYDLKFEPVDAASTGHKADARAKSLAKPEPKRKGRR